MQLTGARDDPIDLDRIVAEVLDQRLNRDSRRPLAVAFSGGGDSLALLLAADRWAAAAGRGLMVLTVDHGLQPESADWTMACGARARALGAGFRALRWEGQKPARGLPAAARQARHRLLAAAAREAGIRVILLGHTADDILEARSMRAAGASTPEPRSWGPSPAWPEGRRLFLLRPLLGVRREALRRWLTAHGERWIEDPANLDMRFARARARRDLAAQALPPPQEEPPMPRALAAACRGDAAGVLTIERRLLREATATESASFLSVACVCAAGTTRPPIAARVERLSQALMSERPVTASLAGARIEADAQDARFMREPGEAARGGLLRREIAAGAVTVWDGRFEIRAGQHTLEVHALAGFAARLPKEERRALSVFPAKARAGLPAATVDEHVVCLALDPTRCQPLALERLQAALGLVEREPL